MPSNSSFPLEGHTINGAYYPSGNQIVLGEGLEDAGPLVRHEMLHALMPTTPGHSRDQFLDRCGEIVVCIDRCVSDAGGPPDWPATAPVVTPSSVSVSVVVAPNPVSLSADGGWFPVTVAVTNSAPNAVRVPIPLVPNGNLPPTSFSYRLTPVAGGPSDSGGLLRLDGGFLVLASAGAAGATRRVVFDNAPTLTHTPAGAYAVTGIFLGMASKAIVLQIEP